MHDTADRPVTRGFGASLEAPVGSAAVDLAASAPVVDIMLDTAMQPAVVRPQRAAVGRETVRRQRLSPAYRCAYIGGMLFEGTRGNRVFFVGGDAVVHRNAGGKRASNRDLPKCSGGPPSGGAVEFRADAIQIREHRSF